MLLRPDRIMVPVWAWAVCENSKACWFGRYNVTGACRHGKDCVLDSTLVSLGRCGAILKRGAMEIESDRELGLAGAGQVGSQHKHPTQDAHSALANGRVVSRSWLVALKLDW